MVRDPGTARLFVDRVRIHVRGGKGGDGCVSFRREKYVPKGGPDGGNGGHGGSVFLVAKAGVNTLIDLSGKHHWHADNGRPGEGANCHGKRGKPLHVEVPTGTLVYDDESGRLLKDLVEDGQSVCVARGGRGGFGNTHYATATHQTPRESQPGTRGQERTLRLELKLIADVGLVGLPNAGKSTLLARLTNANPKIASYPFTTKCPQLGIAELSDFRRIVMADIPGLIAGAHEGVGLGDEFLRHIERTRIVVHLVDLCPPEGSPAPAEAYRTIRAELEKYSPVLAERRELVVGTKMDLTDAKEALGEFEREIDRPVSAMSAVSGFGLREFTERMWAEIEEARADEERRPKERIDFGEVDDLALVDSDDGDDLFADDEFDAGDPGDGPRA